MQYSLYRDLPVSTLTLGTGDVVGTGAVITFEGVLYLPLVRK